MGIVTYAQLRIVTSAKMKFVACLFLLFAVVYGKKELRASNCGSSRSISRLDALWDDKRSGPIDKNSVLNIRYTTGVDTSGRDPFDLDFKFSLAKYMIFGYVPVPGWVLDHAGKAIHNPPYIIYKGNGALRAQRPFQKNGCRTLYATKRSINTKNPISKSRRGTKKSNGTPSWFGKWMVQDTIGSKNKFWTARFLLSTRSKNPVDLE